MWALDWYSTRLARVGAGALTAAGIAFALVLLLGVASAHAAATASVAITSPTEGSTVKGTVTITAVASAGAGDHPTSVVFDDGASEIGSVDCEGSNPCTATERWHASGLSGTHTLTAHAYTEEGGSAASAGVSVDVVSPPPTVSITSPGNGATVEGTVPVAITAATDPSQEDYPTEIDVYDGANEIGSVDCQQQQTCQGTVNWRATGLSGVHSLTARAYTYAGLSVTSAADSVTVLSPPPSVTITSPRPGARLGGNITVAVSAQTDPSQADYPTSISVFDGSNEIGEIECQQQQTCSGTLVWRTHGLSGRHTLAAVVYTETGRSAVSPHVIVGGSPPHPRYAPVHCHLSSYAVRVRHHVRGLCTMPGGPAGTKVAIQYRVRGRWTTVASGVVTANGTYRFTLRGASRPGYSVSALVSANRLYTATRTAIGVLRVR